MRWLVVIISRAFPVVILAACSVLGGLVELPETLGNLHLFSDFMRPVFPEQNAVHAGTGNELLFQVIASLVSLAGIAAAFVLFLRSPRMAEKLAQSPAGAGLQRFWFSGWGFDWLYERLLINPFLWLARINRNDFIDSGYTGIAHLNRAVHGVLSKTQTGNIRWYAMGIAFGAVVFLGIVMILQ